MITSRRVALALVAATLCVVPAPASADPLEDARQAAREHNFQATVTVSWRNGDDQIVHAMEVRGVDGYLTVDGAREYAMVSDVGMVKSEDRWSDIGYVAQTGPSADEKYEIVQRGHDSVAGRATRTIEFVHNGAIRERYDLDVETNLLLRRRTLDLDGAVVRSVTVEDLSFEDMPYDPPRPDGEPKTIDADELPPPYLAPSSLDGGFQRVGAWKHDGALKVHYSDGIYGITVYQHAANIDSRSGRRMPVGDNSARRWSWGGGDMLMWEDGPLAITVVGNGLSSETAAAAESLDEPRSPSIGQRIRRGCRGLVESISGS